MAALSFVAGSCVPRRRPDGPEDANPMNRRLPAEVGGFVAENWDHLGSMVIIGDPQFCVGICWNDFYIFLFNGME